MENSTWLHPSLLITLALAGIGLVAWAIRLESKTNTNAKELEDYKKEIAEKYVESKKQREEITDRLLSHMMDTKLHYNEQFFNEFRAALNTRFQQVDNQLHDINTKLDKFLNK